MDAYRLKAAVCVAAMVLLMVLYSGLRESRGADIEILTPETTATTTNVIDATTNHAAASKPAREESQLSCLAQVVTVQPGGRLGNRLMEYASVWSLAKLKKLSMAMPKDILEPLEKVYQKLNVQSLEDLLKEPPCQGFNLSEAQVLEKPVDVISRAMKRKQPIVLKKYTVRVADIVSKREQLREQFKFRKDIAESASRTLVDIRDEMAQRVGTQHSKVLVVSIHVRRTDYVEYLRKVTSAKNFSDVGFYRRAAARMRQLLQTEAKAIAFVILSDDRKWCDMELLPELLKDFQEGSPASGAFLAPEEVTSRDHDLAVMSMADHSIYAYGTFGTWGALMAGGRAIVFDLTKANRGAKPPPRTTAMNFARQMKWETLC